MTTPHPSEGTGGTNGEDSSPGNRDAAFPPVEEVTLTTDETAQHEDSPVQPDNA